MCEQCNADSFNYGEVVPGWALVQARRDGVTMQKGDFGLVYFNDPDFWWPKNLRPIPDPFFDMTDEEFDKSAGETWDQYEYFITIVGGIEDRLKTSPEVGYHLYKSCLESGYDPDRHGSRLACWLVHKMAVLLQDAPEWVEILEAEQ